MQAQNSGWALLPPCGLPRGRSPVSLDAKAPDAAFLRCGKCEQHLLLRPACCAIEFIALKSIPQALRQLVVVLLDGQIERLARGLDGFG